MKVVTVAAVLAVLSLSHAAEARDQIRIVGSSTVYPFATAVAETFGKGGKFKTPVVESTGTGGGMKLFCAGVGEEFPDIANASRKITTSELKSCAENHVTGITEIAIGFDGIVIANSVALPPLRVTPDQLYLALAKEVPSGAGESFKTVPTTYQKWSDIDPALPNYKIKVYGPPPTSGTRGAFVELVMEPGCQTFLGIRELKATPEGGEERARQVCETMREDGGYVYSGENDNLIVQKLENYPVAVGIFGYSFLYRNADRLQGATVNGVLPSFETIAGGTYPISRTLYVYVKTAHVQMIPGMREFLAEFTSEGAMGAAGYLAEKGLIALPPERRLESRLIAEALTPLSN